MYLKCHSYEVWSLRYEVQWTEFFVILSHFLHFYPLTTRKIKILKKCKKQQLLEISPLSFYTNVPKIMIICYTFPEIRHMMDVIFVFHFGLIFGLLPPKQPKKSKFKNKMPGDSFYTCVTKIMIT